MEKIKTFIPWEEIEVEAQNQIKNTASMPFIFRHIAVMPDVHYGKGSTVGTVLATQGAIIPAAVGVDIGCGMIAVKTNLKKEQLGDLAKLRESIEKSVPMSMGRFNKKITETAQKRIDELEALPHTGEVKGNWQEQLGTLGGGNHFIEICVDETETIWVTLHSGSRGVGNKVGNAYIKKAQDLCENMFVTLPDKDLAYFPIGSKMFDDYLTDLHWSQHFALLNRDEMMDRVLKDISFAVYGENGHQSEFEVERINCHHNFTQIENHLGGNAWITRKGAIEASIGKKSMIPGSMGTNSYIVSGLGNEESFCSAPHGAGRKMSRKKASKTFNLEDLKKSMEGIEYRESSVLIDEIPGAYKDVEKTIEWAKDLVKVEHTLKQIINCKGD
ncbi:MAG: RtcB family protein [Sphingomonas sp.]|jgi:tRNA-splicing ligase RtcB